MKKYFVLIIIFIVVLVCLVKINIINTIALSTAGNFEENFKRIGDEFGEDFSEFIMDKSPMKIYLGELGDNAAAVKLNDRKINLTKENPFLKIFNPVIDFFKDSFKKVDERFNKNTNKESNKEDVNKETNNELDNVVDDFINSFGDE